MSEIDLKLSIVNHVNGLIHKEPLNWVLILIWLHVFPERENLSLQAGCSPCIFPCTPSTGPWDDTRLRSASRRCEDILLLSVLCLSLSRIDIRMLDCSHTKCNLILVIHHFHVKTAVCGVKNRSNQIISRLTRSYGMHMGVVEDVLFSYGLVWLMAIMAFWLVCNNNSCWLPLWL